MISRHRICHVRIELQSGFEGLIGLPLLHFLYFYSLTMFMSPMALSASFSQPTSTSASSATENDLCCLFICPATRWEQLRDNEQISTLAHKTVVLSLHPLSQARGGVIYHMHIIAHLNNIVLSTASSDSSNFQSFMLLPRQMDNNVFTMSQQIMCGIHHVFHCHLC